MREQDFINLLQSYPDCLFDEKKFKGIINDLFPEETRMNNILVNLFHLGLPRELEEVSVINDPLCYKYKKRAVKTYGIDQKLADEAVRFWCVCYGKRVLNRTLKISAFSPDVVENSQSSDSGVSGIKEKNFKNCPFKITLPQMAVLDGAISLNFRLLPQTGISVDVSLNETYFTDKLNHRYDQYYMGECKPKEMSGKSFGVSVPIDKRSFMLTDSGLVLYFIAGDQRKYEVAYSYRNNTGFALDYVMWRKLSQEEKTRLEESLLIFETKNPSSSGSGDPSTSGTEENTGRPGGQTAPIPGMGEYRNALLREKYYLQNEGGRKYKLTNGTLISHKNGLSTYSFEMEAELNLSDDAPITLHVGAAEAVGSVLVCEGFQIIVIIDKDFGAKIGQALLGIEPWKLLVALVDKLDSISARNRLAMKLMNEGPGLALPGPPSSIPKGQMTAIRAVRNNDITVIWGPPGTGKTYTMAQIACEGLQKGKTILVVSHSNISVDGIVKQTAAGLRNAGMGRLLEEGKALRYGYVRDEELSQDSYAVAYNYVLNHRRDLKDRQDQLIQERDRLKRTGEFNTVKGEQAEQSLKKLRAEIRAAERQYVSKAHLVATTISKVTIDSLFDEKEYDIVMFDEVSMAYVPQIICAASFARQKLVLVGDFRQLAPIVQSDAKKVLGVDVFSYLGITNGMKVCAHPWLVMLNEQRRMHPAISAFPNKYIYNHLLTDHSSVNTNRQEIVAKKPFAGKAVNLISLSGSYCASMKNSDNSRFNILSAIVSFETALRAEQGGEKSIGIITPYAAQTRLIRAMIQDYRKNSTTDITCSTVHQFQGSERNMILFDAVESYPSSKVGWLMGKEMDSVSRLINVAVTRARGKLITVANVKFWENRFKGTNHIFYRLMQYLQDSGNVVSTKEKALQAYIHQLPDTRNICFYAGASDAISALAKDVKQAKEKMVISIPDGDLDKETQGKVLKIVEEAKKNGIHILCKTAGYADLPEGWKKYAWTSENTVFPLIVIDDRVIWYGIPKSRGSFQEGNTNYTTVCHTIYRIRGEHTLEMIKAFSDLEYRVVNGIRSPLSEKAPIGSTGRGRDTGSDSDTRKEYSGLDGYVRKMEKCSKCKSPMTVTRSMKGKVYLKCTSSSCKEIAYITPEIVNRYILQERASCPIHHCGIHARLGQYGVYVKCDQGHFLKPDEI